MFSNENLILSKRIKNKESEFQKTIYSGKQGQWHLKFEQYYWVQNDKAFIVTFTSMIDEFNNYKDVAEKILNSFKIK